MTRCVTCPAAHVNREMHDSQVAPVAQECQCHGAGRRRRQPVRRRVSTLAFQQIAMLICTHQSLDKIRNLLAGCLSSNDDVTSSSRLRLQ